MITNNLFTDDFKLAPYWWDQTPRPVADQSLPASTEVLIIGSGYSGLCAGLQTARAVRNTVIIDAEAAGWGCSSRNGGLVSTAIKPEYEQLSARNGKQKAYAICAEGHAAWEWVRDFVAEEAIECSYRMPGKFYAAHSPKQYEILAKTLSRQTKGLETAYHMVPRSEQFAEIGTDAYYGGAVIDKHASLDPARYHKGLLDRFESANGLVISQCRALVIEKDGDGFIVKTSKGIIKTRDVLVTTNGYSDGVSPWLQRRVIPIGSYMIATEPLPEALMSRLLPTDRSIGDTRKVIFYYRPSPDRSRIIFGGRVTIGETDPKNSAPMLFQDLATLFPDLAGHKISHSWMGYIAYTFDHLAHVGKHDGVYYSMGYCGSGIAMSSYLGTCVARQLLGQKNGQTAFDDLNFQTRPLYYGKPWFLGPSVAWFRFLDRFVR